MGDVAISIGPQETEFPAEPARSTSAAANAATSTSTATAPQPAPAAPPTSSPPSLHPAVPAFDADLLDVPGLFARHAPVLYFHKCERYMPMRLESLVRHCQLVARDDMDDVRISQRELSAAPLMRLVEDPLHEVEVGRPKYMLELVDLEGAKPGDGADVPRRMLCFTEGAFRPSCSAELAANEAIIDLWYVVTFAFNGTRHPHAFDQEYVVCRLKLRLEAGAGPDGFEVKSQLKSTFGSAHGNGVWAIIGRKNDVVKTKDSAGVRPVYYSAMESHAMYGDERKHKRLFRCGTDKCNAGREWDPEELLVLPRPGQVLPTHGRAERLDFRHPMLFDRATGRRRESETDFFFYNTPVYIGNKDNSQAWPTHNKRDMFFSMDAQYKHQGGISNLFYGQWRWKKLSSPRRVRVFKLSVAIGGTVLVALAFAGALWPWIRLEDYGLMAVEAVLFLLGVVASFLILLIFFII